MNNVLFLKVVIGFIIYVLLYLGFYALLEGRIENAHLVTFAIVILLNLVFDRIFRKHWRYYLQAPFQFRPLKQKQILEVLISNLVGSIHYQEVKKLLFEAFEKLLPKTSYAFYIWENSLFYLSHFTHIDQGKELPTTIESSIFNIQLNQEYIDLNTFSSSESDKINILKKLSLSKVYIFSGHNQPFAFLLTTTDASAILNRSPIRSTFNRIQKKAGIILENTGLFLDLERKNFETKKLIEVSHKVLSSLDTQKILDFILDALSSLISFDAAVIFLLDDEGKLLKSTSSRGYEGIDPETLKLKVGQVSAAGFVVQTKEINVIKNVKNAVHYFSSRKETVSQIAAPFLFDGSVLGVITLESDIEGFFEDNEVELIKMFANLVAIAIYNARQVEIRMAKQALELELFNAAAVQKELLIHHIPRINKLMITAENIPSKIVSGDLFDFQKLNDNALAIAIGDVAGKGAPAALMMTLVLASFRSQKKKDSTTVEVVNRMNDLLTQTTIVGKYTTFFYGIIRMDTHKIIFTNAGHNPPMLLKKNGDVHYLKTGGIVLGFLEKQSYEQGEISFESGDIFIAFTDGVTEKMDINEIEFGESRIIETVQKHRDKSVGEIKKALNKSLKSFSSYKTNNDDATIILAKHE